MATHTIRLFGDPVLKRPAAPVAELNGALAKLVDAMYTTMYEAHGAGLAATQVGVQRRLFTYDVQDETGELLNSAIVAIGVAVGKIAISMLSAFAIVYFRFRGASLVFWMIFLTLMLPIPVRILPTYEVVGNLGWLNTYAGLTVPLMASATATFLFRQFYLTIPNELAEAAQLDGAGPLRFLWSFLLPLSWANIAALFVVLFIYGWNEYFWPLLITNTEEMRTVVIGLERLIPRSGTELPTWNYIMAGAMMALVPPVAVILFMQRWFVKGLIESEK